jgi:hypothetical protein
MRTVVSILMSAVLLTHALVAWSQHCDPSCLQCNMLSEASSPPACCHGHSEHHHADHLPAVPCKCKFECKSTCICLPPEKVLLDHAVSALPLAIVQTASNLHNIVAAEAGHGIFLSVLPERVASTRLHLALQVLQI